MAVAFYISILLPISLVDVVLSRTPLSFLTPILQVVHEVKEVFADYFAINAHLFSLGLIGAVAQNLSQWNEGVFQRTLAGLMSVLLSLKKKPLIRYVRYVCLSMLLE